MTMSTDPALVRSLGLALPVIAVVVLCVRRPPVPRELASMVLASAWALLALLPVNLVALRLGWWTYDVDGAVWHGVAVDLWLAWAVLWGALPALLLRSRWPIVGIAAGLVWLDLGAMPLAHPAVRLGETWLVGELVAVTVALVPAMLLARWTLLGRHVVVRGWAQALCAGGLIVGAPLAVLAPEPRWPDVVTSAGIQIVVVCALPSVAAMRELALVGGGTPLPYDPPERLVTSGPYAYVRNPMQLSMVLVFVAMALALGDARLLVAAGAAIAYSAGLAAWHESDQLRADFGAPWVAYRDEVPSWIPRWRPVVTDRATLWVAFDCGICSEVGRWFLRRDPRGLAIRPAADHPELLYRVTYESAGVRADGVAAVARALNHLNLGWAAAGWTLGLPGVRHLVQLCTDAFGAGPRPSRSALEEQDDRLGDTCRLVGTLDLDRRLHDELKAGRELGDLAEGDDGTDAGADQDGRGESHLVEAIVELRSRCLQRVDAHPEIREQRQGQVAVGDGAPERPLLGPLHVDVDPLVVTGGVGERVDPVLVDLQPFAGTDLAAGGGGDFFESGECAHPRNLA